MTKPIASFLPALVAVLLAGAPPVAAAQSALSPANQRTSDEAIHRDHAAFERTQGRIQALNDAGRPLRDYHLAKAQCWLDVAFHEYTRNDRSDFPELALAESTALVTAMEQGADPISHDTPLVNGAARLREDLWDRLGAVVAGPGFSCAQPAVACGEVELVHAGNEYNQQQWRHAKPYIQIAEDMVVEAELLARDCAVPAPAAAAPVPAAESTDVLFAFDRSGAADITAGSLRSLDEMLAGIRSRGTTITSVELVGHADRLDGNAGDYNLRLSKARAETVGSLLAARGIDPGLIAYRYLGDSGQVEACEGIGPGESLRRCLLPNRRVEVRITTEPDVD